ncbi:MAG: bifunctional diaminohydroxyphosphoribosylaminopyrimidine deaminase/5-amino-6-(5-phosphoribosylamino)uracil reductase RibD [Bacteroidia bacterium]|nr:bifunctional diaminohydroxyphosphoribosylaminopyrimidine deaminase/5-amino-6-(5-phosphoribosylamino)uracil reductase RibD [Bacteroidia bacterium]
MTQVDDRLYLRRCLQLAANGKQTCSPNPMVGAVIVHNGRIIGEGWHRKAGEPHAEPNAVRSVKECELLCESTMYVSLEPCSHYGKTPPCVELIIQWGIPRVVIGTLDPFPLVAGRGVAKLKEAGIEVVVGMEEEACRKLNQAYFHYLSTGRPRVILKWAQTADGFIDSVRFVEDQKPSLKISTTFTRMVTHKVRSECDAILVGTNTALLDDPSLNVRFWSGKNPIRLVIDRQGVLLNTSKLLDGSIETIVFSGIKSDHEGKTRWIKLDFTENVLNQMMTELHRLKIQSLLVEGGALLHESFLDDNLWDEIQVETSNQIAGTGVCAPTIENRFLLSYGIQKYDAGSTYREIRIYQHAH